MTALDLITVLPALILCGWACLVLIADLFIPAGQKKWTGWLAFVGLVAAGGGMATWVGKGLSGFGDMLSVDTFAMLVGFIFLTAAALTILLAIGYLPRHGLERGEFYPLLLFSASGMVLMTQANNLIIVFLALELLSIPLYILDGLARPRPSSEEAALKYFLLGAFALGFLVYGTALAYGGTGTTNLTRMTVAVTDGKASLGLLLAGGALILVGLGFKVAVVPFQMWTPDVYEGAPTVVTAFMSVGAKAAGFVTLLRVFLTAFPAIATQWTGLAAILAALTMVLGNFAAATQTNVKRLLAYSSIAHAGYILAGVVAAGAATSPSQTTLAVSSVVFYLMAYALTNLGAWAIVSAVERAEGAGLKLDDYAGLGKRRPALALAMALFMFSLTGLPPTVGFVAKFYVFRMALETGYLWLALVAVLTSLISAFYYLRVIAVMYMREGEGEVSAPAALKVVVGLTALATLVFGIIPAPLMALLPR